MNFRLSVRSWLVDFSLLTLVSGGVAWATVHYWLNSWEPVSLFGLFGVAPLVLWTLAGIFLFEPDADAPVRQRVVLLIPVFLGGLLFGGMFAGWRSADLRRSTVDLAAEYRLVGPVERALDDEEPAVRAEACRRLEPIGDEESWDLLAARLRDESADVVDCALETLPQLPTDGRGIRTVAAHSYRELMFAEDDRLTGDRACRLSDRIRHADRLGTASAPRWLFQCALDAPTAPARACCGQSLRSALGRTDATLPMILPAPERLADSSFIQHVPRLLRAAFSMEPDRARLRLSGPAEQVWALSVACEGLAVGGARWRGPISGTVAEVIATPDCALQPATERTVRIWLASCSEIVTPTAIEAPEGDESGRLCERIGTGIAADALNEARHGVQLSVRRARKPGRADLMMEQLLDYSVRDAGREEMANMRRERSGKNSFRFSAAGVGRRNRRKESVEPVHRQDEFLHVVEQILHKRMTKPPGPPRLSR